MVFSKPEVEEDYLYLPVADGTEVLAALADRVRSLGGLAREAVTQRPHMTIGRDDEMGHALAQANGLPPVSMVLDRFVIEQYGQDDVSIPVFTDVMQGAG